MGKQNRGKALWNIPSRGRGTCPLCKTERIKVLYDKLLPDGAKIKVCKKCRHKKLENN